MPPTAASREAWALIAELFHGSRREWSRNFADLGLAPMHAFALRHLDPERGVPMSALAAALRCDSSNVTGIARRLEAAGLVERRQVDGDRRVKTLVLTPQGREVREQVLVKMSEPPPSLGRLPAADAAQLRDILLRAMSA